LPKQLDLSWHADMLDGSWKDYQLRWDRTGMHWIINNNGQVQII
jgi:hypothetical protein